MLVAIAIVVLPVFFLEIAHTSSISNFFGSIIGSTASAQETTDASTSCNSQTCQIPGDSDGQSNSSDTISISDNAIVAVVGPAGSIDDISDQPTDVSPSFYIVQPKDTISLIAEIFNVSVGTIKSANSISSSAIFPAKPLSFRQFLG